MMSTGLRLRQRSIVQKQIFLIPYSLLHSSTRTNSDIKSIKQNYDHIAQKLGLKSTNLGVFNGKWSCGKGCVEDMVTPVSNEILSSVTFSTFEDYDSTLNEMSSSKRLWANTPAPMRGEVVRKIGNRLRNLKEELGILVSIEMGKIYAEGLGEVQEAIDICDYAVGLSRALNGSVIPSERPGHHMMERYNPLKGHVGIITAFNFPVAVYFWNLALSLVCGNTSLWKPHESSSLTAIAVTKIVAEVLDESGYPGAIASLLCGNGKDIGERMIADRRMELISFTGSTQVGRHVARTVSGRFGKVILELGGNNAMIVDESANLDLAVRATLFGAVGTAGQRCTTQRRLYLHQSIYQKFLDRLIPAYQSMEVKIGSPLDQNTLCGPLHCKASVQLFLDTLNKATNETNGGKVLFGGRHLQDLPGNYVVPSIVAIPPGSEITREERFVPILYVMKVESTEQAIEFNNDVSQGLSSCLFTQNLSQVYEWSGPNGSDCGIVNVNIGTSGAEIGGAFGGEKETGGGRESGSDAWKQYMRRSTCTINYSNALPLAQGINFGN